MTQYTRPPEDRASDMFWDACLGGAGAWVMCSCGTEWNPEADPDDIDDSFYNDDYNTFRYVELEGKTFVEDCDECCKKLARYEQWIWNHREEIRNYLQIRVDQQLKWAEQERLLNDIAGIDRRV
jgi:hypothetical protein